MSETKTKSRRKNTDAKVVNNVEVPVVDVNVEVPVVEVPVVDESVPVVEVPVDESVKLVNDESVDPVQHL